MVYNLENIQNTVGLYRAKLQALEKVDADLYNSILMGYLVNFHNSTYKVELDLTEISKARSSEDKYIDENFLKNLKTNKSLSKKDFAQLDYEKIIKGFYLIQKYKINWKDIQHYTNYIQRKEHQFDIVVEKNVKESGYSTDAIKNGSLEKK